VKFGYLPLKLRFGFVPKNQSDGHKNGLKVEGAAILGHFLKKNLSITANKHGGIHGYMNILISFG